MTHRDSLTFHFMFTDSFHITVTAIHYSLQTALSELLTLLMAPRLILLISSGSRKKEPRYACLSEAKASQLQRMRAEDLSSAPQLLYNGLSDSSIR